MHLYVCIALISCISTLQAHNYARTALQSLQCALATYGKKHHPPQRTAVVRALQNTYPAYLAKHPELLHQSAQTLTSCPAVDHPLIEHKELITDSIAQFSPKTGYHYTLYTLLAYHEQENFLKGYSYELYVARTLHAIFGIKIIGFGTYVRIGGLLRQFDIQTAHSFIECKNIHWPQRDRCQTATLDQQFLDQRRIIDALNQQEGPYIYEVCSNHPIPDDWHLFFNNNRIATRQIAMPCTTDIA